MQRVRSRLTPSVTATPMTVSLPGWRHTVACRGWVSLHASPARVLLKLHTVQSLRRLLLQTEFAGKSHAPPFFVGYKGDNSTLPLGTTGPVQCTNVHPRRHHHCQLIIHMLAGLSQWHCRGRVSNMELELMRGRPVGCDEVSTGVQRQLCRQSLCF
jgi:hypothetical protein